MIYIINYTKFGNVCLIRIYKVFSEYKRRLISTHIYFSNVNYLQKYTILKFVAPETFCILTLWFYLFLNVVCDIV